MSYNPKYNEQAYKYRKDNLKRVGVDFNKTYYSEVLSPAVEESGLTISGYIKQAISEKIERENKDRS